MTSDIDALSSACRWNRMLPSTLLRSLRALAFAFGVACFVLSTVGAPNASAEPMRRTASTVSCAQLFPRAEPQNGSESRSGASEAEGRRFATPRETIEAFLAEFEYQRSGRAVDRERSASAFQARDGLAGLTRAGEHAERLAKTFDHVAEIDPARFEHELIYLDANQARWTVVSEIDPALVLELGFVRTQARGWLIDEATAAKIYGWYIRAADLERLASVSEKPLSTVEFVRGWVPKRLKGGGFLLEAWQWIGLLAMLLVAFFFERLLTIAVRPLIRKLGRTEGVNLPPERLASFERPFGWFLLGWLWLAAVQLLDLPPHAYMPLRIGVDLFLTVTTVWTLYGLVDVLCWPLFVKAQRTANKFDDMFVPLLRRTIKLFVLLIGVIVFVSRITGDVWHVLAGLSIGSLAVGFAAKDSIENLFGTFTVLLDGPFKLGDFVKFGDIEGSIEEVGFRSTRIRTPEDSLISVPNSRFIASHVDNLGARRMRRAKFDVAVTYDTPPEKIEALCEGIRELVRAHPWTRNENYHVWLSRYEASALVIEVIAYIDVVDHPTFLRERHRFMLDVLRLARRLEVSFAFPTSTVWVARPEDVVHRSVPADGPQALLSGREIAQQVAAESLGRLGGKPPPVRYDSNDPNAITF